MVGWSAETGWGVRWQVYHSEPTAVFNLAHMVSGVMLDLAQVLSPASWTRFPARIRQCTDIQKLNQTLEPPTGQIRLISGPECSQDFAGYRVRFLTGVEPLRGSRPALQSWLLKSLLFISYKQAALMTKRELLEGSHLTVKVFRPPQSP